MEADDSIPVRRARREHELPPMVGAATHQVEYPREPVAERIGAGWQELKASPAQQLVLAIVVPLAERDDERAVQVGRARSGTPCAVVPSHGRQSAEEAEGRHGRVTS